MKKILLSLAALALAAAPALAGSFTLKFKTAAEYTPYSTENVADYIEGGLPAQVSGVTISSNSNNRFGANTDGMYAYGTGRFYMDLSSPLKVYGAQNEALLEEVG